MRRRLPARCMRQLVCGSESRTISKLKRASPWKLVPDKGRVRCSVEEYSVGDPNYELSDLEVSFVVIVSIFAAIVVVVFGFFLIGLACVAFAKPVIAEGFFMSFASSARTHYT